jgi:uncharacterized protein YdcH (DUF465 family)
MNLVEIYDFKMEELLEKEKEVRDRLKTVEGVLELTKKEFNDLQKEKQELKEELESNLRFWNRE